MSATNVLSDRDVNVSAPQQQASNNGDIKSMEYHRQMLQNKLEEESGEQKYVSPSDTIMSPASAKLSAYKNKRFGKAKPQSLFAKTQSKNLGLFGEKKAAPGSVEGESLGA